MDHVIADKIESILIDAGYKKDDNRCDVVAREKDISSRDIWSAYPVLSLLESEPRWPSDDDVEVTQRIAKLVDPRLRGVVQRFELPIVKDVYPYRPGLKRIDILPIPMRGSRAHVINHSSCPCIVINEHELFLADAMALFAATHAPIFAEIHRMAAHHSPVELPENTTDPDIYEPLLTLAFFRRLYDPSFLKAIGTYLPFLNLQNLFLADVISHQAPLGAPVGFDMIAKHRDEHLELFAPDLPRVAPYFARTFVLAYLTRIVAHEVCHIAGEHFRKQARAIPLKENLIPAPGDKPRIWLEAEADALVIPYLAGHTALEQEIEWQSPYFSLGTAAGASVGFPLSVYTASFTLGRPLDDMDVFVSTLLMNRAIGEFPGLLGTHPTAMERMDVAFTGECLLPRPLRTNKDLFEITLSALCVMYHVMKGSWIHMEAGSQFPRPAPLPDDHLKMHPLLGADALLERIRKATALDAHDGQRLRASMEQFRSDPVNAWNINAHTAPHYEEMTEFLKDPFPRIKVI